MASITLFLAAAPPQSMTQVWVWSGILVAVLLVGFVVIVLVRRMISESGMDQKEIFSLSDLRKLHAAGEMTDEEFEAAKAAVIGALRASGPTGKGSSTTGRASSENVPSRKNPSDAPRKPGEGGSPPGNDHRP